MLSLWRAAGCDPVSALPHASLAALHREAGLAPLALWHYRRALALASPRQRPAARHNYDSFRLQLQQQQQQPCCTSASLPDESVRLMTMQHWSQLYGLRPE